MAAERERPGLNEVHPPRDLEDASRPSTSMDHWEAQSVDVHKTAFPVYEEDDDRGLSKTFRVSIISGSVLIMIAVILCLVVILPRSGRRHGRNLLEGTSDQIVLACRATRYPNICESSLKSDPAAVAATRTEELVKAAISVASGGGVQSHNLAQDLLKVSGANVNLTEAARVCEYLLRRAESFFARCQRVTPLASQIEDVQAWMSAVLTYENDCWSTLSYVNTTEMVDQLMEAMDYVITLTSNALSMVYAFRTYGGDTGRWQPPTRRSVGGGSAAGKGGGGGGSWGGGGGVTVSKDGSGEFESIQAAVDAAPEGATTRFTIYVRRGIYEETVVIPAEKPLLAFVGDGMGQTVITGGRNAQMPGVTTYDSATVAVDGDGFVAVGMTFENSAGAAMHQAVALRVDSDMAAFYNCSILGFQDTLYVHSLRQFYRNCRIEGTIDFIFGNSAAFFQNCQIFIRPGNPGVATSVVAANGRTDPAETTGIVFHNCSLDGTSSFLQTYLSSPASRHRVYLGRPWKLFSRTVFLESRLSQIISPDGWLPWKGTFALDTLFYAEYLDSGPGSHPTDRVSWSSQISYSEALSFTIDPFIQGDRWLPGTNVPFTLALGWEEADVDLLG